MAMVTTLFGMLSKLCCQSCAPALHNLVIGCTVVVDNVLGMSLRLQCPAHLQSTRLV